MPFFILLIPLIILLIPIVLIAGAVDKPFAKRRKANLKETIAKDWIPRQKYVYIGYNDDLAITQYLEQSIFPRYKEHIIYDKWSSKDNEWSESEPDTYRRVTSIWQDVIGDFDGDPICIVAVLTPDKTELTESMMDVYWFDHTKDGMVLLEGKEMPLKDAEKKIDNDITFGLASWKDRQ